LEGRVSFSSLRVRLMALVLLAVLPALVLVLYDGVQDRRRGAGNAKNDAMRFAQLVAVQHKQTIDGSRQLLVSLAQLREALPKETGDCGSLFSKLIGHYPQYAYVGVADPDGNVLCSSTASAAKHASIAGSAFFRRALQSHDFSMGDYEIDPMSRAAVLSFGYPVYGDSGELRSVLFLALDLASLNRFAAEARFHEGERLTVRDSWGTILVRYPDPEKWVGRTDPDAAILDAVDSGHFEGTAEAPGVDGVECLYAFTPLAGTPEGRAYLSIGIPTSLAYAESNRQLKINMASLGIVSFLIAIVAWLASDLFVLRQVRALVRATERLAAGDMEGRSGMPYGRGELGYLAYMFDTMAESLERNLKDLKQSEEQFRAQYQSIPVPTFTWRKEKSDLVLVDYNNAAEKASRGGLNKYLGKTDREMYRSVPEVLQDLKTCFDEKTTIKRDLVSYRGRPTGEEKDLVVTYAYVPPNLVMVHQEDITEQRRLEKMVMIREKMAALGKVAAGIAHEIRNPLSGINIYLHALDKLITARGGSEDEKEIISELKSASGKIENVIKRVLNFAKPGQLKLNSVNVNKHVEEAIKLARVILEKNLVSMETELDADLPECYADPYLLEQVILNLINNAAEAMREQADPKRIEVTTQSEDGRVLISVSDSGPGVPEDLTAKIFDPFFTTKKDGAGIGLSICQRIVTDHGGSLCLSTGKWGGTRFVVELPAKSDERCEDSRRMVLS
jgi:signal transduction histidine kinase/HAMP domain-containing protein